MLIKYSAVVQWGFITCDTQLFKLLPLLARPEPLGPDISGTVLYWYVHVHGIGPWGVQVHGVRTSRHRGGNALGHRAEVVGEG